MLLILKLWWYLYTVVHLTLVKLLGHGRLTVAVENLFDERYISDFFRETAARMIRGEWCGGSDALLSSANLLLFVGHVAIAT